MASATAQRIGVHNTHADVIRRSKGHSVTAAAAYNSRCRIVDERTAEIHDYTRAINQPLFSGFFPAANAQEWAQERVSFWNAVERKENRVDSQLARTFIITLPHEMNPEHARYALQDFVKENFTRKGYGADLAIHPAHSHGDDRNLHAHLLVALRKIDRDGQWAKQKDPSEANVPQLTRWKEQCAHHLNRQLERFGYDIRVDHRSLQERGIDQEPQVKLGKDAAALERQGIATDKGDINREIAERNRQRQQDQEQRKAREVAELVHIAALEEPPADLWERSRDNPKQLAELRENAEQEQRRSQEAERLQQEADEQYAAAKFEQLYGADSEPTHVSAIERQRQEDDIRRREQPTQARLGVLSAIWRLTRTLGVSLSHIVLGANRGDLMQGRRLEDYEREQKQSQNQKTAIGPPPPKVKRTLEHMPRTFVERSPQDAPFHAIALTPEIPEQKAVEPQVTAWSRSPGQEPKAPKAEPPKQEQAPPQQEQGQPEYLDDILREQQEKFRKQLTQELPKLGRSQELDDDFELY